METEASGCSIGIALEEECNKKIYSRNVGILAASDLSQDDKKLLEWRSEVLLREDSTVCFHHEKMYLSKYKNTQRYCSDPFKLHKKRISKSLRAIDEDTAKELNLKPGQKLCPNCNYKYKQHDYISSSSSEEFEPLNRALQSLDTSSSVLGLSPIKSVSQRDKLSYGKRKIQDYQTVATQKVAKVLDVPTNELSPITKAEPCKKCEDLDRMICLLKDKCKHASRQEQIKLLTLVPASWTIKKTMTEFNVSEHIIKRAREVKKNKGILAEPDPKKGRPLSTKVVERVKAFYQSDEYSLMCLGKKEYVSVRTGDGREQMQKCLLLLNLKELHIEYLKTTGDKIGFSKFCELRPKWCVTVNSRGMHSVNKISVNQVGDGTTSVVILAGTMLGVAEQFIDQKMHPVIIIQAYRQALEDAVAILKDKLSIPVDLNDESKTIEVIKSCIGTKFMGQYADLACSIAIRAVKTIQSDNEGKKDIDIKKWARIEKVPGGTIESCRVLSGVMVNKDVTHPKMKRRIEKPRIILLDCPLEYKKGESQTNVEITDETDFTKMLEIEEEHVKSMCQDLIAMQPDLVITEKGVSDLAQHYLIKANITCIRRVRKSDNNRLARACGATIANRTEELKEEDVGTGAGLFEVQKIGDEYFTFITECENPKACTILLRGPSKDILNEVERNLQDALCVARNLALDPFLVPGGGAVEMATSFHLREKAKSISGVKQWPYLSLIDSLEIIPKTLAQNCGGNIIRLLTALRVKHACGNSSWGVNGETGELADMNELKIWEPLAVKLQVYKTAVETAVMLLRIDDIVSGSKKKQDDGGAGGQPMPDEMMN